MTHDIEVPPLEDDEFSRELYRAFRRAVVAYADDAQGDLHLQALEFWGLAPELRTCVNDAFQVVAGRTLESLIEEVLEAQEQREALIIDDEEVEF